MQEESKEKSKDVSFESLRILSERWKNGTFSEIIDDWKWILGYSARYKGAIVFYTILGILSTSLGLVGSVAGKYLIDIITGYQIQKLPLLLCIMIGSTVFSLGFESVINRISTKLGIAINNDIQADIFDKIVDADWLEISKYANGDVLNRFNGDIGTVSGNAISWLPTIIIAVYRFIATFFVILHYDWVMALIAFLSAPFLLLMSRFMIRRQREYSKEVREMSSNLMSFEVEAFYNFDTIKSFGIAPYYSKKMRWWQGLFKDISLKYNLFTIKTNIVMSILGSAVEFTAFGYCLFRLWTHDITYGTMTLFLQQRSNLSGAFGNVISIIPSFLNSSVSAHRIRELVELPKEVHIPDSAKLDPLAKDGFRVQMHGVEFSYIEGNKVITRSEFQAAPRRDCSVGWPVRRGKNNDDPPDSRPYPPAGGGNRDHCLKRKNGSHERRNASSLRLCAAGKYDPFRHNRRKYAHGKRGCDRRGDHRSAQNLLRLGFRPASAGYHQQPRRGTWPRFLRRPVSAACHRPCRPPRCPGAASR